mgnify:CR=1 FL=1
MMKNPPQPGELLREDVLQPLGIEVAEAAQRLQDAARNQGIGFICRIRIDEPDAFLN